MMINDLIEPNAASTGTFGTLTARSGDLVITTPGALFYGVDFFGWVDVKAADVTFINCTFRGGKPRTTSTGLVNCYDASVKNLRVEHCTFKPTTPDHNITGIMGHDFTLAFCDISNCVDGIGVFNTAAPNTDARVTIYRNYVHDLSFFSPDSNHGDNRTHNDCIQIQGGWNIVVKENSLNGYYNPLIGTVNQPSGQASISCIMLNDNVGELAGLVIEDNWLRGGAMPLNGGGLSRDATKPPLGRIWRNRFARDAGVVGWQLNIDVSYKGYVDLGQGDAQNFFIDDGSLVVAKWG